MEERAGHINEKKKSAKKGPKEYLSKPPKGEGEHGEKPAVKKEGLEEEYRAAPENMEEESMEEKSMEEKYYEEEAMKEAEGEGGDDGEKVRMALEKIKEGVDELVSMIGADVTFDVEEEKPEGGMSDEMPAAGGEGEEDEEESYEEVAYTEEAIAEAKAKKGHKKVHNPLLAMGGNKHKGATGLTEKKHMAKKDAEHEEEEEEESLEETFDAEALAEELTRRVAARLMKEMKSAKKGHGGGKMVSGMKPLAPSTAHAAKKAKKK
jgi:hypothetical protein